MDLKTFVVLGIFIFVIIYSEPCEGSQIKKGQRKGKDEGAVTLNGDAVFCEDIKHTCFLKQVKTQCPTLCKEEIACCQSMKGLCKIREIMEMCPVSCELDLEMIKDNSIQRKGRDA